MQIPASLSITKGVRDAVLGHVIQDVQLNCFNEGEYQLDTLSFDRVNALIGQKVVQADATSLQTEEGLTVQYSYFDGGIRLFARDTEPPKIKKAPKTGGFTVTFVFETACLMVVLNSWSCGFRIYTSEEQIPRFPLDITSPIDFTRERFQAWLDSRGNITIIDACASCRGAFDVTIPFMNYIFWMCGIHPKSKVRALSADEIEKIYNTVVKIVEDYNTGKLTCSHIDLYGKHVKENNQSASLMTAKNRHKPCPKCGTPIESVVGTGTKYYFCPSCQKPKK